MPNDRTAKLDRLELLLEQIKAVEAERDALLDAEQTKASAPPPMLLGVHGVGPDYGRVGSRGCWLARARRQWRHALLIIGAAKSPPQGSPGRPSLGHGEIDKDAPTVWIVSASLDVAGAPSRGLSEGEERGEANAIWPARNGPKQAAAKAPIGLLRETITKGSGEYTTRAGIGALKDGA
jgi:hypothetical protein